MSALERAEEDVARGDHWLAVKRLQAYVNSKGYDPNILERAGEIAYEMHDAYTAGRLWLTSTASGERVDQAIDTFVAHAGVHPEQVLSQLPRGLRLSDVGSYPPLVQERLKRLALDDALGRFVGGHRSHVHTLDWQGRLFIVGLASACVIGVICAVVGAGAILVWLFD